MVTAHAGYPGLSSARISPFTLIGLAIGTALSGGAAKASVIGDLIAQGKYCSATAQAIRQACGH